MGAHFSRGPPPPDWAVEGATRITENAKQLRDQGTGTGSGAILESHDLNKGRRAQVPPAY